MAEGKIFLHFSDSIRDALDEYEVDVETLLHEAGIEAEVQLEALPPLHAEERSRDVVPVIMAASVAAVSLAAATAIVTAAISKALVRIAARPRYVEYQVEQPVRDAQGNPVLKANGEVQTIRVPVREFVEPQELTQETFTAEIGLTKGVIVRMKTTPQA